MLNSAPDDQLANQRWVIQKQPSTKMFLEQKSEHHTEHYLDQLSRILENARTGEQTSQQFRAVRKHIWTKPGN